MAKTATTKDLSKARTKTKPAPQAAAFPEARLPDTAELTQRLETAHQELRSFGRARKVSVSLPEGLTAIVQERVGKGEFSRYVAEALARQLRLDLLEELSQLLEAEYGPIPEEYIAEAEATWPKFD